MISKENFDKLLQQTAKQQGLQDAVPPPSDPQYETLKDQALNAALDVAWIPGEGERQDVEVTDTEVQQSFEQTKNRELPDREGVPAVPHGAGAHPGGRARAGPGSR